MQANRSRQLDEFMWLFVAFITRKENRDHQGHLLMRAKIWTKMDRHYLINFLLSDVSIYNPYDRMLDKERFKWQSVFKKRIVSLSCDSKLVSMGFFRGKSWSDRLENEDAPGQKGYLYTCVITYVQTHLQSQTWITGKWVSSYVSWWRKLDSTVETCNLLVKYF